MDDNSQAVAPMAATDWGQVFRDITAYGATRFFDTQAADKLYKSGAAQYQISPDGYLYNIGQPAPVGTVAQAGIPPILLLLGVGLAVWLLAKD